MEKYFVREEAESERYQEYLEAEDQKKKAKHEILDWIKTILIGVIAGILLVTFVIQRDNVLGESMAPTLADGSIIFSEKISTYFHKYDRGDVVILDGKGMDGYDQKEYLIKRIVGLPGETIKITEGKVYIKKPGEDEFFLLKEDYLDPSVKTHVMYRGLELGYDEVTLGKNEYYCMGDNRPVSNDSRNLGPFKAKRIKGVAIFRLYPFSDFGPL